MSSSEEGSLVILGGIPTSKDIAPSVIFLVVYVLLFIGLMYRAISPASRTLILVRVFIFALSRLGGYVTRLIIAIDVKDNKYISVSLVTAEVVLFMSGFVALIEPCYTLVANIIAARLQAGPLMFVPRLIRLVLIAVIVMVIISAVNLSSPSPSTDINKYETIRHVCYAIIVAVPAFSILLALTLGRSVVQMREFSSRALSIAIVANTLALGIAIFRLIQSFSNPSDTVNNIIVFYVVECAVEVFLCSIFVVFNIQQLFVKDYKTPTQTELMDYNKPYA